MWKRLHIISTTFEVGSCVWMCSILSKSEYTFIISTYLITCLVSLFLTDNRFDRMGNERAEIIRISEPIKSHWAKEKGLDLNELLSDGPYKEKYRKEMIDWSDDVRQKDPGYFCRLSIEKSMPCHFSI